jgi:hypothetical protein
MAPIIIPYKPEFDGIEKTHTGFHMQQFRENRRSLLSELRWIFRLPEVARSLIPDTLYRVVLPEGKLLQQGKDGLFRGVFYGDRGIDLHTKFAEVRPSLMDAAKAVGSQVLLVSIAMQLSRIEKMGENLSLAMHCDRIAEVLSGVNQFEKAMLLQDHTHREHAILNAVQTLHTGLQKSISELGSRIAEAPDPDNSILYHLIHVSKTQKARKIMGLAEECFYASLRGIKTLAECYAALGETRAASKTLSDYFDMVLACDMRAAAEKARLVEFRSPVPPQEPWETFIKIHSSVTECLHAFGTSELWKQRSAIEIEFLPSELQGDVDANLP